MIVGRAIVGRAIVGLARAPRIVGTSSAMGQSTAAPQMKQGVARTHRERTTGNSSEAVSSYSNSPPIVTTVVSVQPGLPQTAAGDIRTVHDLPPELLLVLPRAGAPGASDLGDVPIAPGRRPSSS